MLIKVCTKKVVLSIKAFSQDESGQGVTEYILLMAIISTGAGLLFRAILSALKGGISLLGGQVEKDLKTGSAPNVIWAN